VDKAFLLTQIEKNVKTCTKCRLCKVALNAVPGEGNADSDLVFIGEAPGANEDASGRPFVGRAGKLLENLLGKIGYTRDQVWIGNIIKHRPPQNRDPLPDELLACSPYLTEQLKILKPALIITLGRFSMNYFFPEGKISRDHGTLLRAKSLLVFPVYHPAAALRSTEMAKTLETDFLKISQVLKNIKSGKIAQLESSKQLVVEIEGQQELF
jgi:uracil-DNA glycosylase